MTTPPSGWKLNQELFATPTFVLFRDQHEVARLTGYHGAREFWKWVGDETLSDAPKRVVYEEGNERPFIGSSYR